MSGRPSLTRRERAALARHIAVQRVARVVQAAFVVLGLVLWWRHGLPGLLFGLVLLWFVSLARPGPSATLDKLTGRLDD